MSDEIRRGYKVLTHDLRSPLQGGAPIVTGPLPATLPTVALDTGKAQCAGGWNYTRDAATALKIGGFWPNGRPSRLFLVEASADAIERGDKRRTSSLTIVREASDEEVTKAVEDFSAVFGDHAAFMAGEQHAWRIALSRPRRDAAAVAGALAIALTQRGLGWSLKEYGDARDAWVAIPTLPNVLGWAMAPEDKAA